MTQLADRPILDSVPVAAAPPWLTVVLILCAVAGVYFRFAGLGKKVFWHDETWTAVHVGGHPMRDIAETLFNGQEVTPAELLAFQRVDPKSRFGDVLVSLAEDDPHHLPLYYAIVRLWVVSFGDSVASLRAVSAIFGVLAIAGMYWLGIELFRSRPAAMLATALFAVSPYFVLFSQEAREYCLWTLTILLASAALLRALRLREIRWWALYAFTVALGIFCHALFALVILSHVMFIFAARHSRRDVMRFICAGLTAAAAFAPLAIYLAPRLRVFKSNTNWITANDLGKLTVLAQFFAGIGRAFVDFTRAQAVAGTIGYTGPALLLIAWAVVELYRTAPKRVRLLPLALAIVPALTFLLPDMLTGGKRSTIYRFMAPIYIAAELTVAYAIARQFASREPRDERADAMRRWLGIGLTAIVLAGGIASCALIARASSWWIKAWGDGLIASADVINRSEKSAVVLSNTADTNLGNVLALSHRLDPRVRLILLRRADWPPLPDDGRDVYFFSTTDSATQQLFAMKLPGLKPAAAGGVLWRIARDAPTGAPTR